MIKRLFFVMFFVPFVVCVFVCCHNADVSYKKTEAILDRSAMPILDVSDVTTLVSDSGITRYRLTTTKWLIFDKAKPPYWEFPTGLHVEQFDENLSAMAFLEAKYAHYNTEQKIWFLRDSVHAKNLEGEEFFTSELYWEQRNERIYSEKSIRIHKKTAIIEGIGFYSNQSLSQYTIINPTGIFPIEE